MNITVVRYRDAIDFGIIARERSVLRVADIAFGFGVAMADLLTTTLEKKEGGEFQTGPSSRSNDASSRRVTSSNRRHEVSRRSAPRGGRVPARTGPDTLGGPGRESRGLPARHRRPLAVRAERRSGALARALARSHLTRLRCRSLFVRASDRGFTTNRGSEGTPGTSAAPLPPRRSDRRLRRRPTSCSARTRPRRAAAGCKRRSRPARRRAR